MKCIRCQKDSTYPERAGQICPGCKGRFGLEPRTGDIATDAAVESAIKAVSSDGKVRWNLENLYYEMCRRKPQPKAALGCGFATFFAVEVFSSMAGYPTFGAVLGTGLAVAAGTRVSRQAQQVKFIARDAFNQMWTRWAQAHGSPATLIVPQAAPKIRPLESDIGDYSFDRAVICDQSQTVDLLVANNFHFENNCAVLTFDGYPAHAFATVKAMLKRNPKLRVWVLHDATPVGCALAGRLHSDPDWFAEGVEIIDVGMRPGHVKALEKMWEPSSGSLASDPKLDESERRWLAKYRLSLACLRPEQVVKRLFRSMSTFTAVSSTSEGFYIDSSSFSSDASTSDGGGDSFG